MAMVKKVAKGVHSVIVDSRLIGFITTERQRSGGFITTFDPERGVKGPRLTEATSSTAREAVIDRRRLATFAESQLRPKQERRGFGAAFRTRRRRL